MFSYFCDARRNLLHSLAPVRNMTIWLVDGVDCEIQVIRQHEGRGSPVDSRQLAQCNLIYGFT